MKEQEPQRRPGLDKSAAPLSAKDSLRALLEVLYPLVYGRRWVIPVMQTYALALLLAVSWPTGHDLDLLYDWLLIGSAIGIIEAGNQVSFFLRKHAPQAALIVKCSTCWAAFTAACVCYMCLLWTSLGRPSANGLWISRVTLSLLLSWALPLYSVNTRVRFLFLQGDFRWRRKGH